MKSKKAQNPFKIPSAKAADQPTTRKMLYLVRDELRGDLRQVHDELRAEIRSEIHSLDTKMEHRFGKMETSLARMELKLEEQNANNRIVLEGLQMLWQRQERTEGRLDRLERAR